jgi:hypothetical protein
MEILFGEGFNTERGLAPLSLRTPLFIFIKADAPLRHPEYRGYAFSRYRFPYILSTGNLRGASVPLVFPPPLKL